MEENNKSVLASNPPIESLHLEGCIFRHYRNGKLYQVLAYAKDHSHNDAEKVVYKEANKESTQVWIRDKSEFFATVTDDNGQVVPRFKIVALKESGC